MKKLTIDAPESHSLNLVKKNIEQMQQLFPNTIKEGKVDFDALKTILGDYCDTPKERFGLNWAGKTEAAREAQRTSNGTLRPCPADSKNWDNTQNVYIEGDNLEVLKLLQKSYQGKVDLIYIDPPYNTGNDFVYNDDYKDNLENYLEQIGESKLWSTQALNDSDGRFHSKWLSMMYPRLVLARNLMADNAVIFISIDDHEQSHLRKICDEIFGENNFVAQIIWERAFAPINLKKHFSESHDYIICYAKDIQKAVCNGLPRSENANNRYQNPDNDARGVWISDNLSVGPRVESNVYEIMTPGGRRVLPPSGYSWRLNKETFEEYKKDNRIWFGENGNNTPRIKRFLSEVKQGITPMTIWKYTEVGHSQDATKELKEVFDGKAVFSYPKSVRLIERIIGLYAGKNDLFLDSFAGSGTTAQAVLNLNKRDGGNRKFILVEMEDYAENITAERVRRVINGYGVGKNAVEGTGGDFSYYELGEPLMIDGYLNERQPLQKIRNYIWYTETHTPLTDAGNSSCYLGRYHNADYYFYYNKEAVTTLSYDTLDIIAEKAEQYIVYADQCLIDKDDLMAKNIIFKKIPRDIRKF